LGLGSKKRQPGTPKPRLRSKKRETTRFHSDRQERATAERLGGETQRGSGATERHKGDVKTDDLLVENKTTEKASIRVEGKWLAKISGEARNAGRIPAVEIEIRGIDDPLCEKQWVMVPASEFAKLVEGP
jgi:hypothetical protein